MRWVVEVGASWQKNALNFDKDLFLFFFEITWFKTEKFSVKTFFFFFYFGDLEITWFWTEKRSDFRWRPFFFWFVLEITWFWTEKRFDCRWRPFFCFFLFWRSLDFGQKNAANLPQSNWNENSGQVRLRLNQSSKKAPPPLSEILATRLISFMKKSPYCTSTRYENWKRIFPDCFTYWLEASLEIITVVLVIDKTMSKKIINQ